MQCASAGYSSEEAQWKSVFSRQVTPTETGRAVERQTIGRVPRSKAKLRQLIG